MGQKVNPNGLRVGVIKNWDSRWFAKDNAFGDLLVEDYNIRKELKKRLFDAGVPAIEIERKNDEIKIMIQCARPGMVVGRGGEDIKKLEEELTKKYGKKVRCSIIEIKNPDTNATLVAENIAAQLEKRIGFRRAMKQCMGRAMRMGAKGIKVSCGGRLGGAEIARTEHYHEGTIPRQTLRADIDYGFAEAAKILVHNKYYLMILAIYIVYYIMSNLTTGAGVFCATYYWGDGSLLGQFSMMKMFPVIIALAFAPVLIKKTGSMQKVNFWGYAISSVLGIPMIYFAMQKNLSMFLLFMFIKGVFAGTLSGSLNALIAEASGYTTRTTGVHMDGMMYSCSSLGVKVGGGIGTAAVGWLLKLGGFVGTATVQSESAIRMIFNLYITFPFVIGIIITVLLAFLDVEKANKKWDAEHQKEAQA